MEVQVAASLRSVDVLQDDSGRRGGGGGCYVPIQLFFVLCFSLVTCKGHEKQTPGLQRVMSP